MTLQTPPTDALPTGSPVEIWTDGACKGNPGVGGWGASVRTAPSDAE